MIKLLLVEDDKAKEKAVVDLISDFDFGFEITIESADSVIQGTKTLQGNEFDLLILDLFLPASKGGTPSADGGAGFLREIKSRQLQPPRYIIGLTAYSVETLESSEIYNEFPAFMIIEYRLGSERWKNAIIDQIIHIGAVSTATVPARDRYDYGIITALPDPEFRQVMNIFPELKPSIIEGDASNYFVGDVVGTDSSTKKIVAAHAPKMGMCSSVLLSAKMISNFAPRFLIMTGIAAGVRGNVNLRDVIAPSYLFAIESGKRRRVGNKVQFEPSPEPLSLSGAIGEYLGSLGSDPNLLLPAVDSWPGDRPAVTPRLIVGAMGTGSAVIQDGKFMTKLLSDSDRKLVGIDMEAYGVAHACEFSAVPKPHCLILKGVCDFADEEKNDKEQVIASYLSAHLARQIIESGRVEDLI